MNKNANIFGKVTLMWCIPITILLIVFCLQLPVKHIYGGRTLIGDPRYILRQEFHISKPDILDRSTSKTEPPSWEEIVNSYTVDICESYPNVSPFLVQSVIWHESTYRPNVSNGNCVGLMQVSTYWHADRAAKLGVTDFYDPYSNILVGVDYLSGLIESYDNIYVALMIYNGDANVNKYYTEGYISSYAKSVVSRQQELEVNSLAAKEG